MAKKAVGKRPGENGIGQTIIFDDGSEEFDAYGTTQLDPTATQAVDAMPAADVPVRAPVSMFGLPAAAQMGGASPVASPNPQAVATDRTPEGAQLRYDQANPEGPGAAARMSAAGVKPVRLEPGIADVIKPEFGGTPETPPAIAQVQLPGSPGGFQPSSKSTTGIREDERNQMYETANAGIEAQRAASEESIGAQEAFVSDLETTALNRYLRAEANALAIAADQKRQNMVNKQIQTKMKDVSEFKPDRTQLFEGTAGGFRAVLSGLGMIAGGMLAGLQGGPNHAMEAVFKMIDDNVRDQVAQNTNVYSELVRRLGDENAAADALKGKHLEALADMSKALELTAKTKEIRAGLAGARQRAEFEATNYALKVQQSLAPQETLNMAYRAPTPASVFTIDRDEEALKGLIGPDADKQVKEFVGTKISGAQNAKTVGEALQYMKELQQDSNTLRAMQSANGGNLPGVDQVLSPAKSPMMRAALARLGIDHEVAASEAYKIVNAQIMRRAKSYGGAITESDIKAAESEVGVYGTQVMDFMQRMHDEASGQVKGVAYGAFQQRAQPVIDIMTQGIGQMQGFRSDKGRPR